MLGRIEPLEHFEHEIVGFESLDPEKARACQILIWNQEDGMMAADVRRMCGEETVLIACVPCGTIDRWSEGEIEAADEYWETPVNLVYAKCRMKKLLTEIKRKRDLQLTQTYLDTAIDSIPDMVWFKAVDGTHVKVNKAFCATVGKSREDVTGRDHCYIWDVSREDFERGEGVCRETEEAVMRERRTLQFTEMVKSHGNMRQFRTYKSPLFDVDGDTIMGTVGIGHDVTDLVNLSTEIEILLSSMPFAIMLRDNGDHVFNVNETFEKYFEMKKEEILGEPYEEWMRKAFCEERMVNSEGFFEAKVQLESSLGRTLEIHENNIYDIFHNVVGKLSIYRDVTMERQLEEQILRNSNTDFMTGLYNRRSLYQFIHNNRNGKIVSLLYVDLDHFKHVNDTYGHKVGDEALILAANVLKECFENEFIARIGGDEFLIVRIGDYDLEELKINAQRFLDRMHEAFRMTEHMGILSASIGIVQSGDPNADIDLLIQQSDWALYKAKENGRGRYWVYESKN